MVEDAERCGIVRSVQRFVGKLASHRVRFVWFYIVREGIEWRRDIAPISTFCMNPRRIRTVFVCATIEFAFHHERIQPWNVQSGVAK